MSRKLKSIKVICDKFLMLHPLHGPSTEIKLDETAAQLGVTKRRLYDIIYVFEAVHLARYVRKNTYLWHGGSQLYTSLRDLKEEARQLKLAGEIYNQAQNLPLSVMGNLARSFLMLFLAEPPGTPISFEQAVNILLKPECENRIRRLYDISNILISIGIIEKVSDYPITVQPVFQYVCPSPPVVEIMTPPTTPRRSNWDELLHVANIELNKLLSEQS